MKPDTDAELIMMYFTKTQKREGEILQSGW